MNLENVEQLQGQIMEIKGRIDRIIQDYKDIEKNSISQTIYNAGEAIQFAAEKTLPAINRKSLKEWNTRAIPIERVNSILADFEQGVMEELVLTPSSLFLKELHRATATIEWLVTHTSIITTVIKEVVEVGSEKAFKWSMLFNPALFFINPKGYTESAGKVIAKDVEDIKLAAAIVMLVLAVGAVEKVVIAFEAGKLKGELVPLNELVKITDERLKRSAFPQGTGRVRRRKRQRMRKKR